MGVDKVEVVHCVDVVAPDCFGQQCLVDYVVGALQEVKQYVVLFLQQCQFLAADIYASACEVEGDVSCFQLVAVGICRALGALPLMLIAAAAQVAFALR